MGIVLSSAHSHSIREIRTTTADTGCVQYFDIYNGHCTFSTQCICPYLTYILGTGILTFKLKLMDNKSDNNFKFLGRPYSIMLKMRGDTQLTLNTYSVAH